MKIKSKEALKRLIVECTRIELGEELELHKDTIFSHKTLGSYPFNGETIIIVEVIYNLGRMNAND